MEVDFSALVREHLLQVYTFVYRLVGDAEDADDVTQEAFVKAWKKFHTFNEGENFRSWVFAIARNTAIDMLRKRHEVTFSEIEDGEGESFMGEIVEDHGPLPDEIIARIEDHDYIMSLLNKISPSQREVIILRHFHELTFDEIGKVLSQPLHTVKTRHNRAIILLRKIISEPKPLPLPYK